jgi:hypothetical protein
MFIGRYPIFFQIAQAAVLGGEDSAESKII